MQGLSIASSIALLSIFSAAAHAQEHSADELAKQLSNPVAALISVPLQLNYDTDFGPQDEGEQWKLNIQPVIPVTLNQTWNLISRTILPVVNQSDVIPGTGSQSGIGDVVQSVFFSPKAPTARGWIWGAGPVFLLPTASDELLGTEKWGAGPTAVFLKQTADGWTYGALVNHIWSFAGESDRADVNATFMQPFLSKGMGKGRTASVAFESTYDWEGEQWTMPLNAGYAQVLKLGTQLVSLQGGVRYYFDKPDGGPDWGLRITFTLLFPK